MEQRPAAIRALDAAQIDADPAFQLRVDPVEVVLQQDVLGRDRRIRLQLEQPVAVGGLPRAERGLGGVDGGLEGVGLGAGQRFARHHPSRLMRHADGRRGSLAGPDRPFDGGGQASVGPVAGQSEVCQADAHPGPLAVLRRGGGKGRTLLLYDTPGRQWLRNAEGGAHFRPHCCSKVTRRPVHQAVRGADRHRHDAGLDERPFRRAAQQPDEAGAPGRRACGNAGSRSLRTPRARVRPGSSVCATGAGSASTTASPGARSIGPAAGGERAPPGRLPRQRGHAAAECTCAPAAQRRQRRVDEGGRQALAREGRDAGRPAARQRLAHHRRHQRGAAGSGRRVQRGDHQRLDQPVVQRARRHALRHRVVRPGPQQRAAARHTRAAARRAPGGRRQHPPGHPPGIGPHRPAPPGRQVVERELRVRRPAWVASDPTRRRNAAMVRLPDSQRWLPLSMRQPSSLS